MNENKFVWKTDRKSRKLLIAEALKLYRIENNLTQKQLAEKVGINLTTYNTYENGVSEPCAETLVRLSHVLGISTDLLLQRNQLDPAGSLQNIANFITRYDELRKEAESRNDPQLTELVKTIKKALDEQIEMLYSPENQNKDITKELLEKLNLPTPPNEQ